ncbi:sensor domain-containing diguanylate cyclase [uncultured Desulfuromusa sp.]|uniref:sensor domain-containing diguanylate cyclase n=1 Tax=uncultured Desulfuromusa sp. TaxID=219183 RepID=UPI002AA80743|nr:sensor domain-containing diguanylate cyclase [uncultured Desulfuromusa sp.]
MQMNYRVVVIIILLLVTLSISVSVINYMVMRQSTEESLVESSLPLTVDNIYTEIQKHIIEPNLVSSMMAHDTFVKDWLLHDEEDTLKIAKYLEAVKNKYGMFTTFLVSEKSLNYYTSKGFIEKIDKDNPSNAWYFTFRDQQDSHEINLDYNPLLANSMIMFINHKILDAEYHVIGATGIGLKISYINDMLKRFRQQYHFKVLFLNEAGDVVLYERGITPMTHLQDIPELNALKDKIISKNGQILDYNIDGEAYLLNTKYIPELDLYLLVEAKVANFMTEVRHTFYLNLLVSLLATSLITVMIIMTIRGYQKKLEHFASFDSLTELPNRRAFNEQLNRHFLLQKRTPGPFSLLFFDIDNFKLINDSLGHQVGDQALRRIAEIIRENIRQTDLMARWGGEEFIIAFINSSVDTARIIAEKLRTCIEEDKALHAIAQGTVSASFGLSEYREDDKVDMLIKRTDDALYEAKATGKNKVVIC